MSDAPSGSFRLSLLGPLPRLGWGLFLLGVALAVLITAGGSLDLVRLSAAVVLFLLAWRFPYAAFYVSVCFGLLLGLTIAVSTGALAFGLHAFGGEIDVTWGELVAAAVLAGWGARLILYWRRRNDRNWEPWLPLLPAYAALVAAHLLSVFSPARPDALLVVKYALRPVAFAYLAFVAVPANFIRNRRRLAAVLAVVMVTGIFFALDGVHSLFVFESGTFALHRARPLLWFGLNPLGGNHNALGELMLFAAPATLAWATLQSSLRRRQVALACTGLMAVVTLLTFARSAWVAMLCETFFLAATVWRSALIRHRRIIAATVIAFLPLAAYMVWFSLSPGVQSSTDARATLTGIALNLFQGSPIVGVGAGTFVDRVAHSWAYVIQFGEPIESHGVIQKLAAETGLLGLCAFGLIIWSLSRFVRAGWRSIRHTDDRETYAYLVAAVIGAGVYQLFDTTYWTARLWLPVGILLAAMRIFRERANRRDPDFLVDHG